MASSYPYLNVAQAYGVPYSEVLRLADELEVCHRGGFVGINIVYEDWTLGTYSAFLHELYRRQEEMKRARDNCSCSPRYKPNCAYLTGGFCIPPPGEA